MFDEIVSELRRSFAFLLVDTPATISFEHIILTGIGDGAIYVVEPSHESLEVALYASKDLKRLMRVRPVGVVLNMLPTRENRREWVKLAKKIAPVLGIIPQDDRLKSAFMRDIPVVAGHPESPSSLAMRGIAESLLKLKLKPIGLTARFERTISKLGS